MDVNQDVVVGQQLVVVVVVDMVPSKNSPKYKNANNSATYTSIIHGQRSTTQSKYYKSRTIRDVIGINEIRINDNGSVEEYVDYALDLVNYENKPLNNSHLSCNL